MDKTIKVNPELFRISTPKKSKRNKTAKRGQSVRKKQKNLEKTTNTLKKALIKKIQAHQERQRLHIEREQLRMKKENERLKEKLKAQEKPATSFAYLKKLQENVKERKQRREEKQVQKQAQKQEVKPYLQEFLKNESIVPKKIQPISLGKHTSNTANVSNSQHEKSKELSIMPMSPVPEPSTPIVLKEPPPYGILKGGSKPLYSSYRKTRKQQERLHTIQQRSKHHTLSETHPPIHVKSNVTIEPNNPELEKRRNKLLQIKSLFKKSKEEKEEPKEEKVNHETTPETTPIGKANSTNSIVPTVHTIPSIPSIEHIPKPPNTSVESFTSPTKLPMPSIKHKLDTPTSTTKSGKCKKRIRRTTRRKYQVGKLDTPKGKKVHLLVKNRSTRKKQLMESKEFKKTPILEVRRYLRERNLIRVGSQAPEHVLRQLYEASRFTGDVENKSSNVLLHNYMNTDGQTDGTLEPVPQTEMNYDVDTFLKEINGQTSTTPGLGDTSALDAMLVNK